MTTNESSHHNLRLIERAIDMDIWVRPITGNFSPRFVEVMRQNTEEAGQKFLGAAVLVGASAHRAAYRLEASGIGRVESHSGNEFFILTDKYKKTVDIFS